MPPAPSPPTQSAGVRGAQRKAHSLIDEAIAALAPLGERAAPLADLAHYMIERDH